MLTNLTKFKNWIRLNMNWSPVKLKSRRQKVLLTLVVVGNNFNVATGADAAVRGDATGEQGTDGAG